MRGFVVIFTTKVAYTTALLGFLAYGAMTIIIGNGVSFLTLFKLFDAWDFFLSKLPYLVIIESIKNMSMYGLFAMLLNALLFGMLIGCYAYRVRIERKLSNASIISSMSTAAFSFLGFGCLACGTTFLLIFTKLFSTSILLSTSVLFLGITLQLAFTTVALIVIYQNVKAASHKSKL